MKQAIEERFILDVLKGYMPVNSYYKLVTKTEDDPEFDTNLPEMFSSRWISRASFLSSVRQ